jgi:hypothetical protein
VKRECKAKGSSAATTLTSIALPAIAWIACAV